MAYRPRNVHKQDTQARVDYGKVVEQWALFEVNKALTRFQFEECSQEDDCELKRDWYTVSNGKKFYAQFKSRDTGNDVLVSVLQPYYAPGDDRNVWARDMVGQDITYYVTYPPNTGYIYLSRAKEVKAICYDLIDEWMATKGRRLPFYSEKYVLHRPELVYQPRAELRFKIEEGDGPRRGQHKVLAFLPPALVPHWKFPVNQSDLRDWLSLHDL